MASWFFFIRQSNYVQEFSNPRTQALISQSADKEPKTVVKNSADSVREVGFYFKITLHGVKSGQWVCPLEEEDDYRRVIMPYQMVRPTQ